MCGSAHLQEHDEAVFTVRSGGKWGTIKQNPRLDRRPCFGEIAPRKDEIVNKPVKPKAARRIIWINVLTVISAAILIGAEVFGAAFAGSWAVASLFNLGAIGAHILEVIFFACGILIMAAFIRAAQRVEPFTASE
jgi:hypothetical protein